MATLTAGVGDGGQNAAHDVMLVQLALATVTTSKSVGYLPGAYNGVYDAKIAAAIRAFQHDHGLLKTGSAGASLEKEGLIKPSSQTLKKLLEALPPGLAAIRTFPGIGVVYLSMDKAAYNASIAGIHDPKHNLRGEFSTKLIKLVSDFYQATGIVLSVQEPFGWWRSFDMQVGLSSDGGPGESIHNYGRAVDMAFRGLKWVDTSGKVQSAPADLNSSFLDRKVQQQFWDARNVVVQKQPALYPTIKAGDKAHIQDLEDRPLDSAASLVALMESVGPRKMKWELFEMTPTKYKCDFGLGGEKYLVGTALDVWITDVADKRWAASLREKHLTPNLKLTKDDLARALNAKSKTDRSFSVDTFLGTKAGSHPPGDVSPANLSDSDLRAVHLLVRREFEAAAASWMKWRPVLYPSEARRPKAGK